VRCGDIDNSVTSAHTLPSAVSTENTRKNLVKKVITGKLISLINLTVNKIIILE
jgi:hypothetical protein